MTNKKQIFKFGKVTEGNGDMGALLGGKGAGLQEMSQLDINVPPGFTITTDVCNGEALDLDQVQSGIDYLEETFGYMPLVSVRSGAPVSMPGMMETILNVGLTKELMPFWKKKLGMKGMYDSRCRLIRMFGETVRGITSTCFEKELQIVLKKNKVKTYLGLNTNAYWGLITRYKRVIKKISIEEFPEEFAKQLYESIDSVFKSWNCKKAIEYRKINGISNDLGTAVTIQAMVFGNKNDQSGTGVYFTRCPNTGEDKLVGEFLINAQGEDVVAGTTTPKPLSQLPSWNMKIAGELTGVAKNLESEYFDMQEIEFTVQDGELFILQTRSGKRSAQAAFKIAVDLVIEGMISTDEALELVTAKQYFELQKPVIDPSFNTPHDLSGLASGGGIVTGVAVFSNEEAINCKEPCILVAKETTPDDIVGINASIGILTSTGGITSHAAVVARGMGKACVVGVSALTVHYGHGLFKGKDDNYNFKQGDKITLDGDTGRVWVGVGVPVIAPGDNPNTSKIIQWLIKKYDIAIKVTPDQLNKATNASFILMAMATSQETIAILESAKYGKPVILDFLEDKRPIPDMDIVISSMFGSLTMEERSSNLEHQLKILLKTNWKDGKDVTLVLPKDNPSVNLLEAHGYKIAKHPETMFDLWNEDLVILSDEFVHEKIGGWGAFHTLADALKKDGNAVNILPEAKTLDELVRVYL